MSYLTLKANDASIASTFTPGWESIGTGGMQYRAVGATEWIDVAKGTPITVDTTGIELKADTIQTSMINTCYFYMTGSISASGDITSLTNGIGGDCTLNSRCYRGMFNECKVLTTPPKLPATTLANYCYMQMFYSCRGLITAPELPATTLAENCYEGMFSLCTSLTTAPKLPATMLASDCYSDMFAYCWSLTAAPELPATALPPSCYYQMFQGCKSLTVAPELPATKANYFCYTRMFQGCSALIFPPELPATVLRDSCYKGMFEDCSSLIGYTTPEPGYTLIHNFPSTDAEEWNDSTYYGINTISTVPANPSSNVNYYFRPVPRIKGKVLGCIAHSY